MEAQEVRAVLNSRLKKSNSGLVTLFHSWTNWSILSHLNAIKVHAKKLPAILKISVIKRRQI